MMIPFMGAQSLVIGKMFGEGFQYGKRKISAMPNEQFNALTFKDMMSNARDEMQASIPTMQQAMRDMQPMVETVVHEFVDYLGLVLKSAPTQAAALGADIFGNIPEELVEFQKRLEDLYKSFGLPMPAIRAYADTGVGIPLGGGQGTSTIPGLTVSEAQEAARLREQRHQEELKRLANIRATAPSTTPSPTAPVRTQAAAGQSQIRERGVLIQEIAHLGNNFTRASKMTVQERQRAQLPTPAQIMVEIKNRQQRLVNLLNRYRF